MLRFLTTTAVIAALLVLPLLAEAASPRAADPSTASATTGKSRRAASMDDKFVKAAARGGMAEVAFGELAQAKASSAEVRDFGRRMTEDHSRANERLKALATQNKVRSPTGLDAKLSAAREKLQNASGPAFDRIYINGQVRDHKKMVALLEKEVSEGKNPDIKAFAADTLPSVRTHLQLAQALQAQLKKRPDKDAGSTDASVTPRQRK